jgi:hypothetical protein
VNVRCKTISARPLVDIMSIAQEVHIEVLKLWRHSELRVLRVELAVGKHRGVVVHSWERERCHQGQRPLRH